MQRHPPARAQIVSGRAGPKISVSGNAERWWQSAVTVTLDASLNELGPLARETVTESFGAWLSSGTQLPHLTFDHRPKVPILQEPDGENRIYYAPITLPGHEGDLAITLGFSDDRTGEIVEADIIVNSRLPFGLLEAVEDPEDSPAARPAPGPGSNGDQTSGPGRKQGHPGSAPNEDVPSEGETKNNDARPTAAPAAKACSDRYDLASVVTHEVGHFFGLGEDMTDPTATMYYSTRPCDLRKRDLVPDDATVMGRLYAEPAEASGSDGRGDLASGASCSVAQGLGDRGPAPRGAVLSALALAFAAFGIRRAHRR